MRKTQITLMLILLVSLPLFSQKKTAYDMKMEWWRDAKLGMFVHWGPYSLYGGVYHGYRQQRGGAEWIMNRCKIPVREYKAMTTTFNPVHFNADSMVKMAKDAGMKYIVFTTKHHDGFAMFKSEHSRFNIMDYTAFGRDIVDEVVQSCRKYGLKIGFYYSQSQDWNNPGGNEARKEMKEGWPNPDSTEIDTYTHEHGGSWDYLQQTATFEEYFYKVSLPQIKELLARYGDVAIFFFDTPQKITKSQANDIMEAFKDYPNVIMNDRLKRPDFPGDYKTPEGRIPKAEDIEGVDWETCMNIGSSWGYKSWENQWKPSEEIIRNLILIASRGGNYLLNVGPDALGDIPQEAQERLRTLGGWLQVNGEAIYGTRRSNIIPQWGACTRKDIGKKSVLYLLVFDWPTDGKLVLEANLKVKKAAMLTGGKALNWKNNGGKIVVDVPSEAPDNIASVIKLELNERLPVDKIISNTAKTFKIEDE